jgi:hypothetical protein
MLLGDERGRRGQPRARTMKERDKLDGFVEIKKRAATFNPA